MNSGFKSKAEEIEWRRSKVLELKSQGQDQREIAHILRVSPATITFDLQCLRNEAKDNIRKYTTEELPLQFRIFKAAMQNTIREYWRLSKEAKNDHDKIDALNHYMESQMQYWGFLLGGEKFENSRQSESRLALYQQQQQQQLIITEGQNRT